MASIAVFGELIGHDSIEDVKKWIADELWTAYGPQPFTVYCIGEFKNIAFAKFQSQRPPNVFKAGTDEYPGVPSSWEIYVRYYIIVGTRAIGSESLSA